MKSYKKINPEGIFAKQITSESDFDGYNFLCTHPSGFDCDCEYREDGHCYDESVVNDTKKCSYCVKKFYIKCYTAIGIEFIYGNIGDYIIFDNHFSRKSIISKEKFEKEYVEAK